MRILNIFFSFLVIIFVTYLVGFFLMDLGKTLKDPSPSERAIQRKLEKENRNWKNLQFQLVDPGQAPPSLRMAVEMGFQLMQKTEERLPEYVKSHLDCTSCHFGGGISVGEPGGGIPLAGVAALYPREDAINHRIEDLAMRVNSCFEKSLNGKPLPLDSQEMSAFLSYLHWISSGYPIYRKVPWLGLKPLQSTHQGNSANGGQLYLEYCAACHGKGGEGGKESHDHPGTKVPPLWGDFSFNKQAGMNREETFASFIYSNMPYENPHLTMEEALDIAAFVTRKPHP